MMAMELTFNLYDEDTVECAGVHVGLTKQQLQLIIASVDKVVPECSNFSTEAKVQVTM